MLPCRYGPKQSRTYHSTPLQFRPSRYCRSGTVRALPGLADPSRYCRSQALASLPHHCTPSPTYPLLPVRCLPFCSITCDSERRRCCRALSGLSLHMRAMTAFAIPGQRSRSTASVASTALTLRARTFRFLPVIAGPSRAYTAGAIHCVARRATPLLPIRFHARLSVPSLAPPMLTSRSLPGRDSPFRA